MRAKYWGLISIVGAFAACKKADDFPIINPTGIDAAVHHDAAVDAPPDAATITGKVCLLTDLRNETTCATGGTGVLTVTLGGTSVETDVSGAFSIVEPPGTMNVWHVSGAGIVTTAMGFDLGTTIPVMASTPYDALAHGNNNDIDPLLGSLVVRCVRGGSPRPGATASAGTDVPVLYDTASATTWGTTATGPLGLAWMPNVPLGPTTATATPGTGASATADVTIEAATLTFVNIDI